MSFTEIELDNLSKLARIDILPDEKLKMLADMQAILGYISEINEVPYTLTGREGELARGEEDVFNVVRDDVVTHATGSNTGAILEEAPSVKDGYVKVEQVLK